MPVEYKYEPQDNTIRVHCSGELTIQEIGRYFLAIEQDDSISKGAVELVDLSKVNNFNLKHTDAATMPQSYSPAHAKREISGTIVFGANWINAGFAKLIEAYFKKFMPAHFFKTVDSALEAEETLAKFRAT
jgi:hypothetical protein